MNRSILNRLPKQTFESWYIRMCTSYFYRFISQCVLLKNSSWVSWGPPIFGHLSSAHLTVVLSMKKSSTSKETGNSPVRHGWVAPSPVKSQNDMEKYGKPIDHCCPFGSKWSAFMRGFPVLPMWKFTGLSKYGIYIFMDDLYYIYIWFIEDL